MGDLRYLLGIHRVDIMKEIVHVMVKQANNGNPSCEKKPGLFLRAIILSKRHFSRRPEILCQLRALTSVNFNIFALAEF